MELKCPICLDFIAAAYGTKCGHSFCHGCILRHLKFNKQCPLCKLSVEESGLRPNHQLERMVKKLKQTVYEDCSDAENEQIEDSNVRHFLNALLCDKMEELKQVQLSLKMVKEDLLRFQDPCVPVSSEYKPTIDQQSLSQLYTDIRVKNNDFYGFSQIFNKVVAKKSFVLMNSVNFGDILQASNVVSSVEYSKNKRQFAVAGSSKQIRVYDYDVFKCPIPVFGATRLACAVNQIATPCKVASLAWSNSDFLASADYEGAVRVYDVETSCNTLTFEEHEKRVWSIDYCKADMNLLVSGSDDGRAKLWSVNQNHSVHTIDLKANVCCVQFHPHNTRFVCAAADHNIYEYDIRKCSSAVSVYKDHKKAVSYVRWLDPYTLLSASTDNTIKQWNTTFGTCVKTYKGHLHEKNFVGLAVSPDCEYFACGSETNRVYIYSKHFESPLVNYNLGGRDPVTGDHIDLDGFTSSITWAGGNELIVGNSLGVIAALCIKQELNREE